MTELDVSNKNVSPMMPNEGGYPHCNQLTSLDVSKNTALTWLSCGYNQLTALDISENTALTQLNCISNQLTTLDISKNTTLKAFFATTIPVPEGYFPL